MKLPFPFAVVLLLSSLSAQAGVKLPSIFGDHMVLQRGTPVPVWGSAGPGEQVTVAFAGQSKSVRADASGKWQVTLDPLPVSAQSGELTVHGPDSSLTLTDVLVGEVWLASGQSNMGFSLSSDLHAAEGATQGAGCPAAFLPGDEHDGRRTTARRKGPLGAFHPGKREGAFPPWPITSPGKSARTRNAPWPSCKPRGAARPSKPGSAWPG